MPNGGTHETRRLGNTREGGSDGETHAVGAALLMLIVGPLCLRPTRHANPFPLREECNEARNAPDYLDKLRGHLRIMCCRRGHVGSTIAAPQTVCPSLEEATHPRCCCEGYPDRPGRASSKE